MLWLTAVLLLSGQAAEGAQPAPATPASVITNPDWDSRPTGEEVSAVYPAVAAAQGIGGEAVLSCEVDARGGLNRCIVFRESPGGMNFGLAALALAPRFHMRPQTRDGRPVACGVVRIPIRFAVDGGPDPVGRTSSRARTRAGPPVLVCPAFADAPSRAELAAAAPGATGFAVIRCTATAAGALSRCDVAHERPEDGPLGEASLRLASRFTLRRTAEAPEFAGAQVDVRLQYGSDAPEYLTRPAWTRSPSAQDVQTALEPVAATAADRTARATVDCEVRTRGVLGGCRVVRAAPEAAGPAVAALAEMFAVSPWSDGGTPQVGARVRLPLGYVAD